MQPTPQDEEQRLRDLLAAAVKFSKKTQRRIEIELELSTGTLSRLLSGGIDLKLRHVFAICAAIDLPADLFFKAFFHGSESPAPPPQAALLHRLLIQLYPNGADHPCESAPAAPADDPSEIEAMVEAALLKFFIVRISPQPLPSPCGQTTGRTALARQEGSTARTPGSRQSPTGAAYGRP